MSKYVTHFPEFSVAFSLVLGNVFICFVLDIKASRLMQYVDVCGGITSLVFFQKVLVQPARPPMAKSA